ncbi:MAG: sigma-70 family RNA polymerase sigma factor [Elusimicrobia bacterium]|nr:sigma-70 family RNA polymerase sigma factor [Elusimicrobiota bacterium]
MPEADRLIQGCRQDPELFRELVGLFQARLYSFLIRLAGRQAADDLFQEVWLRVYQAAPRYEARGKAASWIFKIAHNVALQHHGRRAKQPEAAGDALDALPSGDLDPAAAGERAETLGQVDAAIAALPFEQRQVFLLREFGGMPFKEVAELLEIPLGTALSRMNAALEKLRGRLEDFRA